MEMSKGLGGVSYNKMCPLSLCDFSRFRMNSLDLTEQAQ